jgi:hypothetical protein
MHTQLYIMHVHTRLVCLFKFKPLILLNLECLGVAIRVESVLPGLPVSSLPRQSLPFPTSFRPTLLNLARRRLPSSFRVQV